MKHLPFTKMHGLGNDFIVLNGVSNTFHIHPEHIRQLSDRHTGIGFDQCLIVEPSPSANVDFLYRIYNADGQEVGQCGNGARCLARFIEYYQLSSKKELIVKTASTQLTLYLNTDHTVTVAFAPPHIKNTPSECLIDEVLIQYNEANVGNPHAILRVDNIATAPVESIGPRLSTHPLFPEQTNVSFLQITATDELFLRVYERGVGETKACGSAAVAAAVIAQHYYGCSETTHVHLPGGKLTVHWPQQQGPVFLTGPATFVYEGVLLIDF